MKHFFTILFATLILFSCIFGFEVQAYGEEHDRSEYDVDTYYETLARSFESFMDRDYRQYLASDTVSFPLIADDLKNSGTFQATLSAKHFLTDKNWSDFFAGDFTLEDVQVQYYKTALSCLLMTFEDNCSSILENESADRATNSWREYVASGASMTASVLSEFADGNLSVALELCGLSIDTIADGLSTVEQFQALEIETDMYSAYRDFLELLVDKTDDRLLQIAANNLVRAVDMCYSYRMEHLSEYADLVIDVESDYFFSVFDSALKDLESAGTALPSELTALKGLSSVLSGAGKFMLGAKLGELGWDFVIGSSKTITHYYEICAMSSVRRVLIDEIDSLYSSIEGDDRIETIEQIRNLLWDLTCVTAFGEHCAYRILSEDSGILSDIRRWFHGETDDAWYENVIETINNTKIGIDDIIPDWDYFLLESDDPPVYLKSGKVLLAVNAYDENDELAEVIHFDYNENGLISRSYHDSYSGGILTDWGYDYIYTYDEAGRLISRYYYVDQWDSGFEDVIRSYDSNGLLVSDNMYSEGEVSVEKEYAYDEDGRLVWERAINGSPFLGGKVKNEYSYSYHTDEHDQTVGVRHNETDPSAEDTEIIYNAVGQLIQGYKSELANAFEGKVKYEYLDDPYFCIRDEFSTFSYPYDIEETRFTNIRYAIILDSAGQEVESFWLGSPETAQMNYDENGYLVSVDNIENTYYIKCEFIYGAPGEEPETSNTDTAQQLPPLSYEERTEHYDHVISGGILTGTSDLAYPYFTDDSPIAAMLNESIEGVVDERRVTDVETDEETKEFFKEMADQGLPPGLNDVEVTVTYNGSNLVSLLYCYSDYGSGAAHVYTRYEGHTYDIGTCEELDYRDLAGLKYRQMDACYTREAAAKGVSRPLDQAEAYVLSADGLSVYCNVGEAVPREIITVPFTKDYFDRAPANSGTGEIAESAGGSIDSIESNDSDQSAAGRVTLTVTGDAVNIRSGPGTNYVSLGKVNKGDKLFSTDKSDNWYLVEYGNGTGYIIEDYVTIGTGGIYTETDSGTLAVNGIDVNIRSGPGTEYQSIGKVSRGTTLTITGKSDNWYQVSYNGGTGYIIEDYVIRNN